ncbi:MAG: J domain-containing protein [Sphingomicrobium sp.]
MVRQTRSDDWGFPRWRPYGAKGREATRVRLCDRHGCEDVGDRPAPKAPNSPERWMFCERHAAEYNKGWDYFAGLDAEEAAARAAQEESGASAFRRSAHYQWAGPGDGSRSRDEMRALEMLEVDPDCDFVAVKAAYRTLAKQYHPDVNRDDAEAAKRFQQVQAAYDVLRKGFERREALKD